MSGSCTKPNKADPPHRLAPPRYAPALVRPRRLRFWQRLLTLGLVTLGLVACGGPGSYNDALGAAAPPGTEQPLTGRDRVIVPAAPYAPSAPFAPGGLAPPAGRGQASAFCQDLTQMQDLVPLLLSPDQRSAGLSQARALIEHLATDAPAEIRPAAAALAQAVDRIAADLAAAPPNLADVAGAVAGVQQALGQVRQFAAARC
ncbi:MAG: hypothetical protein QOK39_1924 [Acidimicrobiaceae bacterium]|nr:hypothetical protein [Acidimicrobiaceae bacterium]